MRISELSRTSGVSVATIKYYMREGLLPPGSAGTAPNQAEYGEGHVHRLHLIRTLLQVGGLSVAAARSAVAAIEDGSLSAHEAIAVAHNALPRPRRPTATGAGDDGADLAGARAEVRTYLVDDVGWSVDDAESAVGLLAESLLALRRLGRTVGPGVFAPYVTVAGRMADRELATMDPAAPRDQLVEEAVIGTVVFETAFVALRRLAHADRSAHRFGAVRSSS